jgi:hypothetical protein
MSLSLNCFILGDKPDRTFTVEIPKNKNVSILKDLIKEKKAPHFDHIAASDLDLWLVSFPIDDLSSQNPPTVEPKLRSEKLLSDTFPAKLDINHIHVVARVPGRGVKEEEEKHEEHDQVTELIAITRKSTYNHSGILVHFVEFDHLQGTEQVSRRTLMRLLLRPVRNRADISLSNKMEIQSTTGVTSPQTQPKLELLLSNYITQILATFWTTLPTRT